MRLKACRFSGKMRFFCFVSLSFCKSIRFSGRDSPGVHFMLKNGLLVADLSAMVVNLPRKHVSVTFV